MLLTGRGLAAPSLSFNQNGAGIRQPLGNHRIGNSRQIGFHGRILYHIPFESAMAVRQFQRVLFGNFNESRPEFTHAGGLKIYFWFVYGLQDSLAVLNM